MGKNLKWKALLVVAVVGLSIWKIYPLSKSINLGLDLQGGMHLVLRVDTSKLSPEAKKDAPQRALSIIRNRIDQFGVREPSIQLQGQDRLIIQLPGITDRKRAIDLIGRTAQLEFKLVSDDINLIKKALEGEELKDYELKYLDNKPLLLTKKAQLTGDALDFAKVDFESQFGTPYVSLKFNTKGAIKFSKLTQDNVGKRLAIVLDGIVHSAPVIREKIPSGRAQITGQFSVEEATDLAIVLRAGALPAPIKIEEERTVGPTLGKDSIQKGIKAILIGGICVLVFMAVYYLLAGFVANFALCLNLIFILASLSYFKATLTLPGIAGILLTVGMAVDANVLIFERIREELKFGKPLSPSISSGYSKAFLTILDANLTTLIVALILFQFGTGPVRGFATTLSIGIIASMFTALFVTRIIFDSFTRWWRGFNKLSMFQMIRKPHMRFIEKRKVAYVLSSALILFGLVSFISRGERNFGIDFSGGSIQEFEFMNPVEIENVRYALKQIGLGDSLIQSIKGTSRIILRSFTGETEQILEKFEDEFGKDSFKLLRAEKVGPIVGRDLRRKAVLAVFYALVGICIYISIRFKFKFALAAIVALFHDVLVSIGALSISGRELSLPVIAALLTIVGYSINDTIVVFDRIRENLKRQGKQTLSMVMNSSINQTLSRTLLTSLTTLLVVISLFLFGGEIINDFAFTLLVGVIVGTYSSVFVASPLIIEWSKKKL